MATARNRKAAAPTGVQYRVSVQSTQAHLFAITLTIALSLIHI